MTNRIKALAAGLVVLLATALGLVAGSPAQAYPTCSSHYICFDDGYSGQGARVFTLDPSDRPGCFSVPANKTSSIDNNTIYLDHDIRVYTQSSSCSGLSTLFYAGTEGNMAGQWDNSIDSMYLY